MGAGENGRGRGRGRGGGRWEREMGMGSVRSMANGKIGHVFQEKESNGV